MRCLECFYSSKKAWRRRNEMSREGFCIKKDRCSKKSDVLARFYT